MTTVINLFGGSGIGKSTTAAHLYTEMKYLGMHCELVREYVKNWAWQGQKVGVYDQMYLMGKQTRYESSLYGKVDYIVTDSPLLLPAIYELYYQKVQTVGGAAISFIKKAESNGIKYINVLLTRNKIFDTRGRYETKEQAIEVDQYVKQFLIDNNIPFVELDCEDRLRAVKILELISAAKAA